jgi:hypothetical protein
MSNGMFRRYVPEVGSKYRRFILKALKFSTIFHQNFIQKNSPWGVRGSVVGWGTMLQAGRSRHWVPMKWIFQFTESFQSHYGPGVDSASKRNEYQESSWRVRGGRHLQLITLPSSVSRFARKCGILDLSHPYGPLRLVPIIVLIS